MPSGPARKVICRVPSGVCHWNGTLEACEGKAFSRWQVRGEGQLHGAQRQAPGLLGLLPLRVRRLGEQRAAAAAVEPGLAAGQSGQGGLVVDVGQRLRAAPRAVVG